MTNKEKSIVEAIESITKILRHTHHALENLSRQNLTDDTRKRVASDVSDIRKGLEKLVGGNGTNGQLYYLNLP
jgi:hypothetical protein